MKSLNSTTVAQRATGPILSLALISLAFFLLYLGTLSRLARTIFTLNGSYGLVILAISLWMVWMKKDQLRQLPQKPNIFVGTALTVLGCLMLVAGKLASIMLLQYISMIVTISGLVWLVLGFHYFKSLWLPIVYLFLMFPLVAELLGNFSIHLQYLAAWIGSGLLKLSGMPVFRSGIIVQLPHISLTVARVCNGINHIIALVALSIPLAFLTQRTWLKKSLFILFAVFVAIFANGLRVALIGLWTLFYPGSSFHGPFDLFYSLFILFFGAAVLFLASGLTRILRSTEMKRQNEKSQVENSKQNELVQEHTQPSQNEPEELSAQKKAADSRVPIASPEANMADTPFRNLSLDHKTRPNRGAAPIVTALFLLISTTAYLHLHKPRPVDLRTPLSAFPAEISDWTGHDVDITDKNLLEIGADSQLHRIYRDRSGNELRLYIGYFSQQQQGREIVQYRLDWLLHHKAKVIQVQFGSTMTDIKRTSSAIEGNPETIYFWCDVNGRILVNRYKTKLATLMDAFIRRKTNGALILVSTARSQRISDDTELQFIQSVLPVTAAFLNDHN